MVNKPVQKETPVPLNRKRSRKGYWGQHREAKPLTDPKSSFQFSSFIIRGKRKLGGFGVWELM